MIKHEWIITNNLTFIWHMSCLWSRNWWRGQFRSYFGSFLSSFSIIWQDYDHSRSPPLESCQINFIKLETLVLEQVPDGIRIISPPYRHPEIDKIGNVKDWIFLSDFWLIEKLCNDIKCSSWKFSHSRILIGKVHETDDESWDYLKIISNRWLWHSWNFRAFDFPVDIIYSWNKINIS